MCLGKFTSEAISALNFLSQGINHWLNILKNICLFIGYTSYCISFGSVSFKKAIYLTYQASHGICSSYFFIISIIIMGSLMVTPILFLILVICVFWVFCLFSCLVWWEALLILLLFSNNQLFDSLILLYCSPTDNLINLFSNCILAYTCFCVILLFFL